jgi:hypothetical protein
MASSSMHRNGYYVHGGCTRQHAITVAERGDWAHSGVDCAPILLGCKRIHPLVLGQHSCRRSLMARNKPQWKRFGLTRKGMPRPAESKMELPIDTQYSGHFALSQFGGSQYQSTRKCVAIFFSPWLLPQMQEHLVIFCPTRNPCGRHCGNGAATNQ